MRPVLEDVHVLFPYMRRWDCEQPGLLGMWTATHRSPDGRHIRCITATSARLLAVRLAAADPEETP
jgi:hypothetical protein